MLERVSLRPRVYTPRALFYARVYLITIPATAPPPGPRGPRRACAGPPPCFLDSHQNQMINNYLKKHVPGTPVSMLPSTHCLRQRVQHLTTTVLGESMKRVKVNVPKKYTDGTRSYVDFAYVDPITVMVELLGDEKLVKTADDIYWGSKPEVCEITGSRKFTREINSGRWYEATQAQLLGPASRDSPSASKVTLGPIILWVDDTNLSNFGGNSATPIMMTLACFPDRIRKQRVRVPFDFVFLYIK